MPVGVALLTRGEDEVIARKGFAGLNLLKWLNSL